jgi:hypothetical protein
LGEYHNIPICTYITWNFIGDIVNYLSENISVLYVKKPIVFFEGLSKLMAIGFIINLFLLLIVEFVIVCFFHKRLNKLFGIENLFTIKKFILLMIVILGIQIVFSYWLM